MSARVSATIRARKASRIAGVFRHRDRLEAEQVAREISRDSPDFGHAVGNPAPAVADVDAERVADEREQEGRP